MVIIQATQNHQADSWITFGNGVESFESNKDSRKSSTSRHSSPWAAQPINSDASWVPLQPPPSGKSRTKNGKSSSISQTSLRPSSPTILMNPPDARRQAIMNKTSEAKEGPSKRYSARATQKPEAVINRNRTESTASVSSGRETDSSESLERQRSSRNNASSSSRGRAKTRTDVDTIEGVKPPSTGRDRSNSLARRTSSTRNPSPSPSAARSQKTSSTRNPSPSPSAARSQKAIPHRERSNSRSRPPTIEDKNREKRVRARSASLTRVTHPSSPAAQAGSTSHRRPPNTGRTRTVTRPISSSNSIGPGVPTSQVVTDNASVGTEDANIGLDISFGADRNTLPLSTKETKGSSKKVGVIEKLFGDQVSGQFPGRQQVRPRVLLAATVYHNTATNLWITTINTNQKGVAKNPALANKYLKAFSFATEQEARESAIANAPPKMIPFHESPTCYVCRGKFAMFRRASHCRNCGVCICSSCTFTWSNKMLPETYNLKKESNVRVCKTCNNLNKAFKKALLDGDYEEAIALYGTGNVNLRTPFPLSNKKDEISYPVHCAVEGGNINIVRWLIDDHFCPIKLVRAGTKKSRRSTDVLLQTSKGRTVISIAMERLRVDIMRYLTVECNVTVYEMTDLNMALRALEATLLCLPRSIDRSIKREVEPINPRWDQASFDELSIPSSLGESERFVDDVMTVGSKSQRTRSSRSADCIICYDRKIDCVAVSCGHQVCCLECSSNLSACPVCNNKCQFIKIFRP